MHFNTPDDDEIWVDAKPNLRQNKFSIYIQNDLMADFVVDNTCCSEIRMRSQKTVCYARKTIIAHLKSLY